MIINTEPSATNPKRTRRLARRLGRRFGLKTMLLLIALICVVLSRYYPRVHTIATIDCGATTATEARTHAIVLTSPMILDLVLEKNPGLFEFTDEPPFQWMLGHVEVTSNASNLVEFKVVGYPTEKTSLRLVVDAFSATYVSYLGDQWNAQKQEVFHLLDGARAEMADAKTPNEIRLRDAVEKRIEELHEQVPTVLPKKAKVVRVTAKWGP